MKKTIELQFSPSFRRSFLSLALRKVITISFLSTSLLLSTEAKPSVAQTCNIFGYSQPGAGSCNPFGCPQPNAGSCNPFGCPNPNAGACTPFGCPPSPLAQAPVEQPTETSPKQPVALPEQPVQAPVEQPTETSPEPVASPEQPAVPTIPESVETPVEQPPK